MLKTSFKVKDCMDKTTKTYGNKDDLLSLLDTLGTESYILIGEGKKITNIITSYDALRFFLITPKLGYDFTSIIFHKFKIF